MIKLIIIAAIILTGCTSHQVIDPNMLDTNFPDPPAGKRSVEYTDQELYISMFFD